MLPSLETVTLASGIIGLGWFLFYLMRRDSASFAGDRYDASLMFHEQIDDGDDSDHSDRGGSSDPVDEQHEGDPVTALKKLATSIDEAVCIHREQIIYANPRFAKLVGFPAADLPDRPLAEFLHPDSREIFAKNSWDCLVGHAYPDRYEALIIDASGQMHTVEVASTVIDYEGEAALLTILARRETIESISAPGTSIGKAKETLESIGAAVITTDSEGRIDYLNLAAIELTGSNEQEMLGRRLGDVLTVVDEVTRRKLDDPVGKALAQNVRVHMGPRALLVVRGGQDEYPVELTASPIRSELGKIVGVAVILHDVTELRGLTQRMSYQASHDALTGLINRREFERRLEEALQGARSGDATHVLCYLDLDGFKLVNDTCGHMAGDNMLREIAALIKGAVRDSDTVARIGGDEFGLLLIGCPLSKGQQIADDVCGAVEQYRFVWRDKIFNVGASIGLVEIGHESGSIEDALTAADSACYVAKKQGNHVHVYSARDEAVARHRGEIQWLQRLQTALKENRFELYTQPIVSTSGKVDTGPAYEVLLRLHDESGAEIFPADFMRAAERYRLMGHVDRWVVQTTLAALGRGGVKLPDNRSIAINLSGQTLADPRFLEFIVECFDSTDVSPRRVCFEVTEAAVVTNVSHARRFIAVLHGMGCQFALDDFGSGLGSFANLKSLSMDYLKIDGSFIRNLGTDSVNQAMVAAVVRLAGTLQFRVVAEHVEDQTAFEAAKQIGVDFVQGFLLGRPQPLVASD